ncbi:hypothetical protein BC332_06688 [Capsicum chinense]|nr:hypothetical protein BC332_06688 [Capsicum chinense]
MKVAVVGAGISGLISAYELAKAGVEVVVYEKENYLGGHANTVTVDGSILTLVLWFSIGHGVDMETGWTHVVRAGCLSAHCSQ